MKRLLLPLAVFALYASALRAPFTYDDKIEVVGNRTIRLLGEVGAIASYNTSRPLLMATYALNWWFGGLDPFGYHLVSVAIHALNAALAQRLFGRLISPTRAALAAALWALHPLCTESVTYIAGRSDALCATFWLVAITAWIDHARAPARREVVIALVATAGAFLTKEVAIGLPFALLAVERYLMGRPIRWRDYRGFIAIGAGAALLRLAMYGWPAPEAARGALAQTCSQAEVWFRYLQLWLAPFGQSILHEHPGGASLRGGVAVVGWAAVIGAAIRVGGLPAFCAVVWAGSLLPSSIVPLRETMAEHRAYIAGMAPALLLASAGPALWAAIPVLMALTVLRNQVWNSETTLWAEAVRRNPESASAWYGWGDALRLDRQWAAAEDAYRASLRWRPDDADTRNNLGIVRFEQGDREGARQLWMEALRADPHDCDAHNNLAGLDLRAGRIEGAIAGYSSTIAWCPDDPLAHLALGNLHDARGDVAKARWHLKAYLDVAPPGPATEAARVRFARLAP